MESIRFAICNELIDLANQNSENLTPMKMQKMVFFVYGYYKAKTRKSIFDDERFQVWQFGPVLPSLYSYFKKYGTSNIRKYAVRFDGSMPRFNKEAVQNFDVIQSINLVWAKYGHRSAIDLSTLTHKEDTPWDKARKRDSLYIDDKDIEEYFKKELCNG